MAGKPKATRTRKTVYNKAKSRRKTFGETTSKYKSDHQDKVCSCFIEQNGAIVGSAGNGQSSGTLSNVGPLVDGAPISLGACIALDARNGLLANPSHSAYKGLFNEWNTNAIYIDLLFTKDLRDSCDQVFLLVERGNHTVITDINQMVSDVNAKMYQLGNNTQKLTFKHVFGTTQDKINKLSSSTEPVVSDTMYLKILCKGKAQGAIGDAEASIKMRVKMYNKYRDMRVLTGDSISLN